MQKYMFVVMCLFSSMALAQNVGTISVANCPNMQTPCTTVLTGTPNEIVAAIADRPTKKEMTAAINTAIQDKIASWDAAVLADTLYPQIKEKLFADLLQRISDDPDLKQLAKKLGEISVAARIKKDPAYRKTLTNQIAEAEKPETASAVH